MHRLAYTSAALSACLIIIVCFFLSCTQEPVQTNLLLPIDFSNVPDNMVLTGFHTDKIEIKIEADPRMMDRIKTKDTRYIVDLYTDLEFDPAGDTISIEPGEYLIPVEKKRIPLNANITVLDINPSYLSVRLEKKIRKTFKITVPYIGKPAKGYIALNAATDPVTIELVGPFPLIHSIQELKTKPIDLTNVDESFKKKIPLDLENPSLVPTPNNIIVVSVPVQQRLVTKTLENIPIQIKNAASNVAIEPPNITVHLKGPFEQISNKELMEQVHSFIDLNLLKTGVYARHAYIDVPVGIIMTGAEPSVFTVKVD